MTKQSFMLIGLAIAFGPLAIRMGWFGFPLYWLVVDLLILAGAYLTRSHRVFGKTPTGTLPLWSWWVFLPYLSYTLLVWNLSRVLSREQPYNRVTDNLVVGRRLLAEEQIGEFTNYVDLTAEFSEPREFRESIAYISFPILDAGALEPEELRKAVTSLKPGRTFVHCAQGHGRTGLFSLAMLIASGIATSVEDGLQKLQRARPGIRLNKEQLRCVEAFARLIAERGSLLC